MESKKNHIEIKREKKIQEKSVASDYKAALWEWGVGKKFEIDETLTSSCQLCGRGRLKYVFQIENMKNKNTFKVGSTYIEFFVENGVNIKYEDPFTKETLTFTTKGEIEQYGKRNVLFQLYSKALKESEDNPDKFSNIKPNIFKELSNEGKITIRQLDQILWGVWDEKKLSQLRYILKGKVVIRHIETEKGWVVKLHKSPYNKIMSFLSKDQRKELELPSTKK